MAVLVLVLALLLGSCFSVLQWKMLRSETAIARADRLAHPDPNRGRDLLRGLAVTIGMFGSLGLVFIAGDRIAGFAAGAMAAVAVATVGVLAAVGFALRSAVVSHE